MLTFMDLVTQQLLFIFAYGLLVALLQTFFLLYQVNVNVNIGFDFASLIDFLIVWVSLPFVSKGTKLA